MKEEPSGRLRLWRTYLLTCVLFSFRILFITDLGSKKIYSIKLNLAPLKITPVTIVTDLKKPNGLALDPDNRKLYFADAGLFT